MSRWYSAGAAPGPLFAALVAANVGVWIAVLTAFHQRPSLLAAAGLAYALGLRHALDADHLAAIDNVTRKLIEQGRRPLTVGLHFSLGHSTVVLAVTVLAVLSSRFMDRDFAPLAAVGARLGTVISAGFLVAVGLANLWLFLRQSGAGRGPARGPLGRLLRPFMGGISRSWQMYPLGLLFGLGFDTASEIALLGLAVSQSLGGAGPWAVLALPLLFTAAMALVDSTDGLLMCRLYGWARGDDRRRRRYNRLLTGASSLMALSIAGVELAALAGGRLMGMIAGHSTALGVLMVAFFLVVALSAVGSGGLARNRARQGMED